MDAGSEEPTMFTPREDLLEVLMSMGFSRNASVKGLFYTKNCNPDLAAGWIIENQDKDLETPLEDEGDSSTDDEDGNFPVCGDLFKMVFVVNQELKMGIGKIAARTAHACLGLYRLLLENQYKYGEMLLNWEQYGETKVVLGANSTTELMELKVKATSQELPHYIVQDAGRTQVAAGSFTVLGIMGKVDQVDLVTGKLKLLS
ncbi:probable peptidyl-tRNA hydrolase 2 isoform X2 [Liolophura sinensis]